MISSFVIGLYRRSRFFRNDRVRHFLKLPVIFAIKIFEVVTGFRTASGDSIPYRLNFLLRRDETETVQAIRFMGRKGDIALDVGAHVGYFSRELAELLGPDGQVLSFEPNPTLYTILKSNSAKWRNSRIFNLALGLRSSTGTLVVPAAGSMLGFLSSSDSSATPHAGASTFQVSVVNGSGFLADLDIPCINILKVDVEGAECEVLEGLSAILGKSLSVFAVVELNPSAMSHFDRQSEDLFHKLWSLGFATVECGKYTAYSTISNDFAIADLRSKVGGQYTNLFCFKGFEESRIREICQQIST